MRKVLATSRLLAWGAASALALSPAAAQSLRDVRVPTKPLVLKAQGSFMVGGEAATETPIDLSGPFELKLKDDGTVSRDKMYVQYMVPQRGTGVPVVMIHGATLTGKTYETTPDGRMGWEEYFVRRGHPVFVPDQVGRGRSGFEIAAYNEVRQGIRDPKSLPNAFRLSNELGWKIFRFGPKSGTAFSDEQFPIAYAGELGKQAVPDLFFALPDPNPNYRALADLGNQAKGAVLMGHSQSGFYPLEAALTDDAGVRGLILIEPARCTSPTYNDAAYAKLARKPILVVFGDHLDFDTGIPGANWSTVFTDCQAFIKRINAVGGNAMMLHPPELGIKGNSHMLMQDRNNLQIADLIIKWIDQNVGTAKAVLKPKVRR